MNDGLGNLLRQKLGQAQDAAPDESFKPANLHFYEKVCNFLREQELPYPSFELWMDIRGTALHGRKVDAIKMLRDDTTTVDFVKNASPTFFGDSEFAHYAIENAGATKETRRLGLADSKNIIDLLVFDETFFDDRNAE